ncbi:photosystem II biogenesis protein Psp29 [filamentous cyanobacterium CCP2]|nr:photosystem II biogenesis protein Psp29 [filamentous cyanobacterium CCP2]PSB15504.1 photosystem II biogenesis protein Psp29 [filamentous cyanobacterium CCP2]
MSNVRTVSDTKRAFYTLHTRPINSFYRRVVDELIVEMHLLSVNADFRYDPVYGLGVATAFDRFMQGYRPEQDKDSIFNAICQSLEQDPQKYRQDAEQLCSEAVTLSVDDFLTRVKQLSNENTGGLFGYLRSIAEQPTFKYSRLFAIGLYTLLEIMSPEVVKDETKRNNALTALAEALNISFDKIQKDLELYRSNLDKIAQAQQVMSDILEADRKKKAERAQAKDAIVTPQDSQEST